MRVIPLGTSVPHEKVYGEFKNPNNKINMTDKDMVNLITLKFLSEYYGRNPIEMVQSQSAGKTFLAINEGYWLKKNENKLQWDVEIPSSDSNLTPTVQATPHHHGHRGSSSGFSAPPGKGLGAERN